MPKELKKFSKDDAEDAVKKLNVTFDKFTIDALLDGMNIELEHPEFVKGKPENAAKIALAHLKEGPEYYKKLKKMEKTNAKDFPDFYYAKHMESGLCGYEKENVLVDADAMKNMSKSFAGKPVYVGHQKVDLEKIDGADGYVLDCFYNELDGWLWSKILIKTDKGKQAINQGWSVSNAYIPSEFAAGGQHHSVDFNRKIVNADFTHLAIVPNPRYEGAKVYTPEEYKAYCVAKKTQLEELKNSKGVSKMFKRLFKNKEEEVTTIDDDTMVELTNGKTVSVKEMIESVTANEEKKNADDEKKKEKDEDEAKLNADTEVDVGGKKTRLGDLMNAYQKVQKENAEAEEKKKKDDEEKVNTEKDKEKEDAEKKNQKHFDELKNAKNKSSEVVHVDTSMDQLARGKDRYGSK